VIVPPLKDKMSWMNGKTGAVHIYLVEPLWGR
jgi:hypothetical protein